MKSPKAYNFFSLAEFAIVFAVVAVVAAIIAPSAYYIRSETRAKKIEEQLMKISQAGRVFISENGVRRVSCSTLAKQNFIKQPTVFYGESYKDVVVDSGGGFLTVTTKTGREIKVKY